MWPGNWGYKDTEEKPRIKNHPLLLFPEKNYGLLRNLDEHLKFSNNNYFSISYTFNKIITGFFRILLYPQLVFNKPYSFSDTADPLTPQV